MNTNNQNSVLTRAGSIILIFTIIFSVLFIVLGAVNLISNDNSPSGNNNGNSSYRAYEGTTLNIPATSGRYYEIKFTPNSTGTHTINMDGAYISSITNSNGSSINYETKYGSFYDHSYTTYLSSVYTYTVKIYATQSHVTFYANY